MTATDDAGVERRTTGVIGALELSPPGTDILPHEHTTKKAKSDRLDLLRSCRANLSAIWGLSLAKGLTDLLPVDQRAAGRRRRRGRRAPHRVAGRRPGRLRRHLGGRGRAAGGGGRRAPPLRDVPRLQGRAGGRRRRRRRGRRHARLHRGAGRGRAHRARHPPPDRRPARRHRGRRRCWPPGSRTAGPPPEGVPVTAAMEDAGCLTPRAPRSGGAARAPPRRAGRRARPRLEPPRRRPGRAARRTSSRFQHGVAQRAGRGRVGRRAGRRAAAPGHGRPDRGDRPRRRAHAPEDHVLPPQAEDRLVFRALG